MHQFGKKYLIIMIIMAMMIVVSCSSDSKTVKFSPSSYDFGNTNIGDAVEVDVVITNKMGKEITVTGINLSGSSDYKMKSNVVLPKIMLNKDEISIKVAFEPSTAGELFGLLSLNHTEADKTYEMKLQGLGVAVARIQVTDKSYNFDKKLINKSHTYDIGVENIGTSDLSINALNLVGTNASLFSVVNTPMIIHPAGIDKITVTFSPLVIGNYSAELQISHNAVNESNPLSITLQGEGIDLDPRITLSCGSSWDFGAVPTTINAIQICEIENTGIDPLTVASADIATGTEFSVYEIEDSNGSPITLPNVVAVGDKIFLYVEFKPASSTPYNDTLTIEHDGTNETTPINIPLSGTGRTATTQTINYSGAIVNWTVPVGVTIVRIETWGAQGGDGGASGGKGSRMRGDFIVKPGDTLKILVGQKGGGIPLNALGGGGGGTYVWKDGATDPMIVSGAGGGSGYGSGGTPGIDAVTTQDGVDGYGTWAVGGHGTNGNGGVKPSYPQRIGGGGAGWKTDGCDGVNSASGTDAGGGKCPANGGAGGAMGGTNTSNGAGGFGGGGGAQGRNGASAAGGGGGYSGGGSGAENPSGISYQTAAGGAGGSYNDGMNQDNTAATNTGNGKIVLTY